MAKIDMNPPSAHDLLEQIRHGRTDVVFDCLDTGVPLAMTDSDGVSLMQWCAYYGDVSAIRYLLSEGESLSSLGPNLDLNGAAFHGHWRLCQFLIECGANVNHALPDTGETALHAALSDGNTHAAESILRVLFAAGADPNCATKAGALSGCFMRDTRTRAESPLHRAAAFGSERAIQLLLDAGSKVDARDMNGDTPLSWASWHRRSDSVLRLLLYGDFTIHPDRRPMKESLDGEPIYEK